METPSYPRADDALEGGTSPQRAGAARNVSEVARLEQLAVREHSRLERFSATIARATGSMPFFAIHVAWFTLWIALNLHLTSIPPFDPYPFSFLTMTVSLEAIFLSNFVLMAQNLETRDADRRAQLTLQVDLLAEQESTATLRMVYALCRAAKIEVPLDSDHLKELLCDTSVAAVAEELKQTLDDKARA